MAPSFLSNICNRLGRAEFSKPVYAASGVKEELSFFIWLIFKISEMTLPGIYVVGDELGQDVVLGRNVLNHLRLLLDGPARLMKLLNES